MTKTVYITHCTRCRRETLSYGAHVATCYYCSSGDVRPAGSRPDATPGAKWTWTSVTEPPPLTDAQFAEFIEAIQDYLTARKVVAHVSGGDREGGDLNK